MGVGADIQYKFGAFFYSMGIQHVNPFHPKPTRELCWPHLTQGKRGREDLEQMKLNGPGRSKLEKKEFRAVGEACVAMLTHSRLQRGEPWTAVGSQQRDPVDYWWLTLIQPCKSFQGEA